MRRKTPFARWWKKGVALIDNGDYAGALELYNKALGYNDNYYLAHSEKTVSLCYAGRYQECIDECKLVLDRFRDNPDNGLVYVNYGSSLDGMGKPSEAIGAYKEGMRKFPKFYRLPLNKAVTEVNQHNTDDAIKDLEGSLVLEPAHASTHMYLGDVVSANNRIAAVLSYMTFLLVEPEGPRAERNVKRTTAGSRIDGHRIWSIGRRHAAGRSGCR